MEGEQTGHNVWHRLNHLEGLERKKSAALLFVGTLFGFFGFVFAFLIGFWKFLTPELDKLQREAEQWGAHWHKSFNGTRQFGYFPSTVSEMVADPEDPAGKCFFAFEFIGAVMIFLSWYPWRLRHVWIGDDESFACGVSWSMFRQFTPPLGMMLVATVTTTPFAKANPLDLVTISIHLWGAVMLFGGYALCEAKTIGWLFFSNFQPEVMRMLLSKPQAQRERGWRSIFLWQIIIWYAFFSLLQVVLILPTPIPHPDEWKNVTRIHNETNKTWSENFIYLANPASGLHKILKILSYVSEVFCGVALLSSLFTIWYFSEERHIDLDEELSQVTVRATTANELALRRGE